MLIVNPFATATSPAGRDALVHTLSAHFHLDVEHTTHRGHAGELAQRALAEEFDVVIVHGGDGSVNEAANGLLDPPNASDPTRRRPALAVIPGGSANVFARTLGIDADPLAATRQIIGLIDSGQCRRIGLGHAADRWFLFNCGMGMDAVVVHAMEDKRHAGKAATPMRYLWTTVSSFLRNAGSSATFDVEIPGRDPITGARFGFVSNTSPWTYLGKREIRTNPNTGFDSRLGVFVATSSGALRNIPLAVRLLAQADPKARHLFRDDDVEAVRFVAAEPIDVQMDGDYIGAFTDIRFGHRRAALDVVAPLATSTTDTTK
ncbi:MULTISPECIES: diacylglycerol kinase family protein [unclassified Gordonia (in: high G+C Gram-positive bacteria)]|uniref:diacylglycerol/lipid kinase family protein n=1 Tax=unclassified Gordonia (in: high G+C Gram-positive bacteria) TaxID=2657482 RepID=UPI001F0F3048|nr:diacylglycerol kinase family protein [Gordonia sp. ABSL49_1]MCH5645064.1 diacylglycerol kinase family lipid kinase [Gordonia sp. ABSL49_1]